MHILLLNRRVLMYCPTKFSNWKKISAAFWRLLSVENLNSSPVAQLTFSQTIVFICYITMKTHTDHLFYFIYAAIPLYTLPKLSNFHLSIFMIPCHCVVTLVFHVNKLVIGHVYRPYICIIRLLSNYHLRLLWSLSFIVICKGMIMMMIILL